MEKIKVSKDFSNNPQMETVVKAFEYRVNDALKRYQEAETKRTAWDIVGQIYALVMFANAAEIITYEELEEFYRPILNDYENDWN